MEVCYISSHVHIFTSSHVPILTPSHFHSFTSSHLLTFASSHLLTFTSPYLHIFTSSHLHVFASSHLHIFTSSHLHIFTSSHLLTWLTFTASHLRIFTSSLSVSCHLSRSLSFFFFSLLRPQAVPTRRHDMATLPHEMRFECPKLIFFLRFYVSSSKLFARSSRVKS